MKDQKDPRVEAIRKDKVVGLGSCSYIDECLDDSELASALDRLKITEPRAAVEYARREEQLELEQGLNCRWGDDSDEELKMYEEFKRRCEENPITL